MKTDFYRLERIEEIGAQLLEVIEDTDLSAERLSSDYRLQWLVSTPLYNIGEQVSCLSRELTDAYPDQPWSSIAGLRHRLVHDYEGTNWEPIASILTTEMRPFVERVSEIATELSSAEE